MPIRQVRLKLIALLGIVAAPALLLCAGAPAALSAPLALSQPAAPAPLIQPAQVFKRGRTPRYPYVYNPPRRPGGWSTYFGFVPYAKGDFEVQALQRLYPQTNWPPSMRYWTPQSQF